VLSLYFITFFITISFINFVPLEAKLFSKLPSEIKFAHSVLKKIQLGRLAYCTVTDKSGVSCITNDDMSSWRDCIFKAYFCGFHSPMKQANCKAYTHYCALHRDYTCLYQILHSSQKFDGMSAYTKCRCKLCVKV